MKRTQAEAMELRRAQNPGPAWLPRAVELHELGYTQEEIGAELGIKQSSVSSGMTRWGVTRSRSGVRILEVVQDD